MFTLFDLMRAAQGGAALNNMARQFGLTVEQTQRAMEALMPAFSMAFQRNATDPMGFSNLMRMMTTGQYAGFFDNPALAFTPAAMSHGSDILRQLFGPEVSRQVERQAAAWAGVAPEVMSQLLPVTAAMLMGGLFRSAATEGLADFFQNLANTLRGEAGRSPGRSRAEALDAAVPDPLRFWSTMMGAMAGAGQTERNETAKASDPPPDLFSAWADMMKGMLAAGQPAPARPPEPPPAPERSPQANPFAFFGRLFETGIEVQQQHLATLQNIFDTYWGARPPPR